MRLKYSYFFVFFVIFLFSGCSGKSFFNKNHKKSNSYHQEYLNPSMRVSDGVITKIKVLSNRRGLFGLGSKQYSYYMESFLDDGRVVKSKFSSPEAFFIGDRIRLISEGKKLKEVRLIYRN